MLFYEIVAVDQLGNILDYHFCFGGGIPCLLKALNLQVPMLHVLDQVDDKMLVLVHHEQVDILLLRN